MVRKDEHHQISLGLREAPTRVEVWIRGVLRTEVMRERGESYEDVQHRAAHVAEQLVNEDAERAKIRYAKPVDDMLAVSVDELPDGVTVLRVPLPPSYGSACLAWQSLPQALELDGKRHIRSGYSSDRMEGYYRHDPGPQGNRRLAQISDS